MAWRSLFVALFLAGNAALLGFPANGEVGKLSWQPTAPRPGDPVFITVESTVPLATLRGNVTGASSHFFPGRSPALYHSIAGIDLSTPPGSYKLEVEAMTRGGLEINLSATLVVTAREFGTQHLTLPQEMVELSPETLARVRKEEEMVRQVWGKVGDLRLWDGPFIAPVEGTVTSPFGLRRIINGEERQPHGGVDIFAPHQTPVRAANSGRVALVADLFFTGVSVILDHGLELFTMYYHLDRAKVISGDMVTKGQIIGYLGSTGRTTGPHLHLAARVAGARIDPLLLIELKIE